MTAGTTADKGRAPGDGALPFTSVDELASALAGHAYLADRGLATAIYRALHLDKPLLLEGGAGVGETAPQSVCATCWTASWSGHSATRGSTPARPCTSGTPPASSSPCGPPSW